MGQFKTSFSHFISPMNIRYSDLFFRPFMVILILCIGFTHSLYAREPQYASMVTTSDGKHVLQAENPDKLSYPASLTKMMTLFLLFDALSARKIKLSTRLKISARAAQQPPCKLGLKAGEKITVQDAMMGLIVKSANDAAVVIAENLEGSEEKFAKKMTEKAKTIGLRKTIFKNASGLPHRGQVTTARDMVTLGRKLYQAYPNYYRFFKTKTFMYKGQTYRNHNRLLSKCAGVDGIKTGYINASGFNLVSSAHREKTRIFAVVLGAKSAKWRDARMQQIVNASFPQACRYYQQQSKRQGKLGYNNQHPWVLTGFIPPTKPLTLEQSQDEVHEDAYLPEDDIIGEFLTLE